MYMVCLVIHEKREQGKAVHSNQTMFCLVSVCIHTLTCMLMCLLIHTHTLGSLYRSLKELAETKLLDGTGRKPHYRCDKLL